MKIRRMTDRRPPHPALAAVVGAILVFLLVGCGQKEPENAAVGQQSPALDPPNELNSGVAKLDSTLSEPGAQPGVDLGQEKGTLPEAEGVRGNPGPGKPVGPRTEPELKAAVAEVTPAVRRPATSVSSGGSGFSLQLGSFTSLANARKQVDRLSALGYNPVIEEFNLGGQVYHRVMLKGVGDMAETSRLGEYIHSELGIAYLVRRGE